MTVMNVNPTRMELSNLKSRLEVAKRGHKLLKDKQDELVRRFIIMIREDEKLRKNVEKELESSFRDFTMASAMSDSKILELALSIPNRKVELDMEVENVMSVQIPKMEFIKKDVLEKETSDGDSGNIYPYGFAHTNVELDMAIEKLEKILDMLLRLAEVEKSSQMLADEIETTRRRVNALEYRTIPDLEDTIRFIRMRLEENERETISRLMKTKDLIADK